MALATPVPRNRKRRRRQVASPTPPPALPRVTASAPANLPSSVNASATTSPVVAAVMPPPQPFADNSDLDVQISALNLIRRYGYGSVPGTPLLPKTASVGRRTRAVRDFATSSRAAGSSITPAGKRANASAGNRIKGAPRDPWMGPLSSGAGLEGLSNQGGRKAGPANVLEPVTLERDEFKTTKAKREAAAKGRCLLSQLGRVLDRRDLGTAAQLLKSARTVFRAAGDASGVVEVDATLIKVKADILVEAMGAARDAREYDRMQDLMFEAQHYFAVLARVGQVQRHDTLCKSKRRDAERQTFERFRYPRRLCREHALDDGRKCTGAAADLSRKRHYAEARSKIEDARWCFDWAGGADEELKKLRRVLGELEMREKSTGGDRLTEGVASKLQFLTSKDYAALFRDLSEAAGAYKIAQDPEGSQVVNLVRGGLQAVQSAEQRWLALMEALSARKYSSASRHLREAKRFVGNAMKGLPFVSPSLARAGKILSPAGGVTPLEIVAELAALDGVKDHGKSVRAFDQGLLDKAQLLNTSAREVFEFTARSRRKDFSSESSAEGSTVDAGSGCNDARQNKTDGAGAEQQQVPASNEANAASAEKKVIRPTFAMSDEQLHEGETLLLKIRRSTSAPSHVDGLAVKPNPRAVAHPGVRDRVEDLLDEVSETEDVITRNKALERGDKLMGLFWEAVAKSGLVSRVGTDGSTARKGNKGGSGGIRSGAVQIGLEREDESHLGEKLSGFGGTLSPEAAGECLRLLAEAREAYDGQGFGQQADSAARLRAGIVADRFLIKAPTLARSATPAAAEAEPLTKATDDTNGTTTDAPCLPLAGGDQSRAGSDFEAARVAARKAGENYTRAGNPGGALRARRTEVSLNGDENMATVAPLLEKREYSAALEGMKQARRLYIEAGPEGAEGLDRTRDPEGMVKAVAMRDGQWLKAQAVRVLRDGDVSKSTDLRQQAQRCFSFVDPKGLAEATDDVDAAVRMVIRLAAGDAVGEAADAALEDGAIGRAIELLGEAKSFYHEAQLSYQSLVDQVTGLLEDRPDDLEAVKKAMELQDNINGIYDSRTDGQRVAKVESRLDCLAADASLENLAQVIDHEKFEDARTLLSGAATVYERSADETRLSKVALITSLVGHVENAAVALGAGLYTDAERCISNALRERSVLEAEQPISLRAPDCALVQGGEDGAKAAVLLRVRTAGGKDRMNALALLENGEFEAAEAAAASASKRLGWWADHASGDADDREVVVRTAQELTERVVAAAGRARAGEHIKEGRCLKALGDFAGAVRALNAAAKMFIAAGLADAATAARAEANQAEAEASMLVAEGLHSTGNFEAVAEHLQTAEKLLLEAIEIRPHVKQTFDNSTAEPNDRTDQGLDKGPQSHLDDLRNLQFRVLGDIVMREVPPAFDAREYDRALQLMLEADGHYTEINAGRWTTSAVVAAGKEISPGATAAAASPKELAMKRAARDGDRLRADAATAIQKESNPIKAQELLSDAEWCMEWAGVDPFTAGTAVVAKDIKIFESRVAGDKICRGLIQTLRDKDLGRAKDMLEEALGKYRLGNAFKQIADTRAVVFCVEREEQLCHAVVFAVTARDPVAAVKVLEESRPVFEVAAEMRSEVFQDVAHVMCAKHRHIVLLSTLCRAWVQSINGVTPPGDSENNPHPATVVNAALSDIHRLADSGASILDVPFDVLQEACESATFIREAPPTAVMELDPTLVGAALPESAGDPGARAQGVMPNDTGFVDEAFSHGIGGDFDGDEERADYIQEHVQDESAFPQDTPQTWEGGKEEATELMVKPDGEVIHAEGDNPLALPFGDTDDVWTRSTDESVAVTTQGDARALTDNESSELFLPGPESDAVHSSALFDDLDPDNGDETPSVSSAQEIRAREEACNVPGPLAEMRDENTDVDKTNLAPPNLGMENVDETTNRDAEHSEVVEQLRYDDETESNVPIAIQSTKPNDAARKDDTEEPATVRDYTSGSGVDVQHTTSSEHEAPNCEEQAVENSQDTAANTDAPEDKYALLSGEEGLDSVAVDAEDVSHPRAEKASSVEDEGSYYLDDGFGDESDADLTVSSSSSDAASPTDPLQKKPQDETDLGDGDIVLGPEASDPQSKAVTESKGETDADEDYPPDIDKIDDEQSSSRGGSTSTISERSGSRSEEGEDRESTTGKSISGASSSRSARADSSSSQLSDHDFTEDESTQAASIAPPTRPGAAGSVQAVAEQASTDEAVDQDNYSLESSSNPARSEEILDPVTVGHDVQSHVANNDGSMSTPSKFPPPTQAPSHIVESQTSGPPEDDVGITADGSHVFEAPRSSGDGTTASTREKEPSEPLLQDGKQEPLAFPAEDPPADPATGDVTANRNGGEENLNVGNDTLTGESGQHQYSEPVATLVGGGDIAGDEWGAAGETGLIDSASGANGSASVSPDLSAKSEKSELYGENVSEPALKNADTMESAEDLKARVEKIDPFVGGGHEPNRENVDTIKFVEDVQARFKIEPTGEEGTEPGLKHVDTMEFVEGIQTRFKIEPTGEEGFEPNPESTNNAEFSAEDLQTRFSRMLSSFSDRPETAAELPDNTVAAASGTLAESVTPTAEQSIADGGNAFPAEEGTDGVQETGGLDDIYTSIASDADKNWVHSLDRSLPLSVFGTTEDATHFTASGAAGEQEGVDDDDAYSSYAGDEYETDGEEAGGEDASPSPTSPPTADLAGLDGSVDIHSSDGVVAAAHGSADGVKPRQRDATDTAEIKNLLGDVMVSSSSGTPLSATGEVSVAGKQHSEESDDLYNIDDNGLSSSDDD